MPQDTLPWRWHRRWHGHSSHIEDQGGVPGPRDVHVFYRALAEGQRHCGGTVQLYALGAPVGGEFRLLLLSGQRGLIRYLKEWL